VKLANVKADRGIDLSNAIFLALVLAEETRAFFSAPLVYHVTRSPGRGVLLGISWDLRNIRILDILLLAFLCA